MVAGGDVEYRPRDTSALEWIMSPLRRLGNPVEPTAVSRLGYRDSRQVVDATLGTVAEARPGTFSL
jgi:hypothetical protein